MVELSIGYDQIIQWVNDIINDKPTEAHEAFAGRALNMMILMSCNIHNQRPFMIIDIKKIAEAYKRLHYVP